MTIATTASLSIWLWLPLALIGSILVGWFCYYRTTPSLSPRIRWTLTLLRATAFFLLLSALFSVEWIFSNNYQRKFNLGVIIDGSESMTLTDRLGSRREQVAAIVKTIASKANLSTILVANTLLSSDRPSDLWLSDWQSASTTSAERMLQASDSLPQPVDGILWITDGAFLEGDSYPIPTKPVWAIAIGDTIPPANAYLADISFPARAIAGKPCPVRITIAANGMQDASASVRASLSGGNTVERSIKLPSNGAQDTLTVSLLHGATGWRQLTIELTTTGDPFPSDNKRTVPILVRPSQIPVTIVYGKLHPDVAAIHRAIAADSGFAVTTLQQSQSLPQPKSGIVVLLHAPDQTLPGANLLAGWLAKYPGGVLWLPGAAGWSNEVAQRFQASGLRQRGSGERRAVIPVPVSDRMIPGTTTEPEWNRLPPVAGNRGYAIATNYVIATFDATEPAIVLQPGVQRSIAILVHDVWRWSQAPIESGKPGAVSTFWQTLAEWLASESTKRFQIVPASNYSVGITSSTEAIWLSEAGEPVSNGVVTATVGEQTIPFTMREPGRYISQWTPLHEGKATIVASGMLASGTKLLDSVAVEVDRYSSEHQNAIAFPNRLAKTAQSGGGLLPLERVTTLLDSLSQSTVASSTKSIWFLWRSMYTIILALALLCIEWFIRSRNGML